MPPAPRARNSHLLDQIRLGDEIEVWWPDDHKYYPGRITSTLPSGRHRILYTDGEVEDLRLATEQWRFRGAAADRVLRLRANASVQQTPPENEAQPSSKTPAKSPKKPDAKKPTPKKGESSTTSKTASTKKKVAQSPKNKNQTPKKPSTSSPKVSTSTSAPPRTPSATSDAGKSAKAASKPAAKGDAQPGKNPLAKAKAEPAPVPATDNAKANAAKQVQSVPASAPDPAPLVVESAKHTAPTKVVMKTVGAKAAAHDKQTSLQRKTSSNRRISSMTSSRRALAAHTTASAPHTVATGAGGQRRASTGQLSSASSARTQKKKAGSIGVQASTPPAAAQEHKKSVSERAVVSNSAAVAGVGKSAVATPTANVSEAALLTEGKSREGVQRTSSSRSSAAPKKSSAVTVAGRRKAVIVATSAKATAQQKITAGSPQQQIVQLEKSTSSGINKRAPPARPSVGVPKETRAKKEPKETDKMPRARGSRTAPKTPNRSRGASASRTSTSSGAGVTGKSPREAVPGVSKNASSPAKTSKKGMSTNSALRITKQISKPPRQVAKKRASQQPSGTDTDMKISEPVPVASTEDIDSGPDIVEIESKPVAKEASSNRSGTSASSLRKKVTASPTAPKAMDVVRSWRHPASDPFSGYERIPRTKSEIARKAPVTAGDASNSKAQPIENRRFASSSQISRATHEIANAHPEKRSSGARQTPNDVAPAVLGNASRDRASNGYTKESNAKNAQQQASSANSVADRKQSTGSSPTIGSKRHAPIVSSIESKRLKPNAPNLEGQPRSNENLQSKGLHSKNENGSSTPQGHNQRDSDGVPQSGNGSAHRSNSNLLHKPEPAPAKRPRASPNTMNVDSKTADRGAITNSAGIAVTTPTLVKAAAVPNGKNISTPSTAAKIGTPTPQNVNVRTSVGSSLPDPVIVNAPEPRQIQTALPSNHSLNGHVAPSGRGNRVAAPVTESQLQVRPQRVSRGTVGRPRASGRGSHNGEKGNNTLPLDMIMRQITEASAKSLETKLTPLTMKVESLFSENEGRLNAISSEFSSKVDSLGRSVENLREILSQAVTKQLLDNTMKQYSEDLRKALLDMEKVANSRTEALRKSILDEVRGVMKAVTTDIIQRDSVALISKAINKAIGDVAQESQPKSAVQESHAIEGRNAFSGGGGTAVKEPGSNKMDIDDVPLFQRYKSGQMQVSPLPTPAKPTERGESEKEGPSHSHERMVNEQIASKIAELSRPPQSAFITTRPPCPLPGSSHENLVATVRAATAVTPPLVPSASMAKSVAPSTVEKSRSSPPKDQSARFPQTSSIPTKDSEDNELSGKPIMLHAEALMTLGVSPTTPILPAQPEKSADARKPSTESRDKPSLSTTPANGNNDETLAQSLAQTRFPVPQTGVHGNGQGLIHASREVHKQTADGNQTNVAPRSVSLISSKNENQDLEMHRRHEHTEALPVLKAGAACGATPLGKPSISLSSHPGDQPTSTSPRTLGLTSIPVVIGEKEDATKEAEEAKPSTGSNPQEVEGSSSCRPALAKSTTSSIPEPPSSILHDTASGKQGGNDEQIKKTVVEGGTVPATSTIVEEDKLQAISTVSKLVPPKVTIRKSGYGHGNVFQPNRSRLSRTSPVQISRSSPITATQRAQMASTPSPSAPKAYTPPLSLGASLRAIPNPTTNPAERQASRSPNTAQPAVASQPPQVDRRTHIFRGVTTLSGSSEEQKPMEVSPEVTMECTAAPSEEGGKPSATVVSSNPNSTGVAWVRSPVLPVQDCISEGSQRSPNLNTFPNATQSAEHVSTGQLVSRSSSVMSPGSSARVNYKKITWDARHLAGRVVIEWLLSGGCRRAPPMYERERAAPDAWVRGTTERCLADVTSRLRSYSSYGMAFKDLSFSLNSVDLELSWILQGPTPNNLHKARKNYSGWDPRILDFEWESEKRVLSEIAEGIIKSEQGLMRQRRISANPLETATLYVLPARNQ